MRPFLALVIDVRRPVSDLLPCAVCVCVLVVLGAGLRQATADFRFRHACTSLCLTSTHPQANTSALLLYLSRAAVSTPTHIPPQHYTAPRHRPSAAGVPAALAPVRSHPRRTTRDPTPPAPHKAPRHWAGRRKGSELHLLSPTGPPPRPTNTPSRSAIARPLLLLGRPPARYCPAIPEKRTLQRHQLRFTSATAPAAPAETVGRGGRIATLRLSLSARLASSLFGRALQSPAASSARAVRARTTASCRPHLLGQCCCPCPCPRPPGPAALCGSTEAPQSRTLLP